MAAQLAILIRALAAQLRGHGAQLLELCRSLRAVRHHERQDDLPVPTHTFCQQHAGLVCARLLVRRLRAALLRLRLRTRLPRTLLPLRRLGHGHNYLLLQESTRRAHRSGAPLSLGPVDASLQDQVASPALSPLVCRVCARQRAHILSRTAERRRRLLQHHNGQRCLLYPAGVFHHHDGQNDDYRGLRVPRLAAAGRRDRVQRARRAAVATISSQQQLSDAHGRRRDNATDCRKRAPAHRHHRLHSRRVGGKPLDHVPHVRVVLVRWLARLSRHVQLVGQLRPQLLHHLLSQPCVQRELHSYRTS